MTMVTPETGQDIIDVVEAARRLRRHPETIRRLCRAGQFPPAVKVGHGWVISVPLFDALLHNRPPTQEPKA